MPKKLPTGGCGPKGRVAELVAEGKLCDSLGVGWEEPKPFFA
jgi:hypothetical protein